eukprot:CAMPEP_0113478800 /NCGR_PEP_ID=MMETSP0014_2-20120614/20953_1 /TAXON_ID=2857 /ORGANISM="Nitzschia sp." /LENGTH=675 /DNA_ID=CAMNT_0000372023 /DNA_START=138 /DNA_END=2165 /DNA_ORIENTATION=+ /assembly_acc=CAM_ASM_000159
MKTIFVNNSVSIPPLVIVVVFCFVILVSNINNGNSCNASVFHGKHYSESETANEIGSTGHPTSAPTASPTFYEYSQYYEQQWKLLEDDLRKHRSQFYNDFESMAETFEESASSFTKTIDGTASYVKESIEDTASSVVESLEETATQIQHDLVDIQERVDSEFGAVQTYFSKWYHTTWQNFQRQVLKQRNGCLRWTRTIRNHVMAAVALVVIYNGGGTCGGIDTGTGGGETSSSTLTTGSKISLALQATQTVSWILDSFVEIIKRFDTEKKLKRPNDSTLGVDDDHDNQTEKDSDPSPTAWWKGEGFVLLLKDCVMLGVAVMVARQDFATSTDIGPGADAATVIETRPNRRIRDIFQRTMFRNTRRAVSAPAISTRGKLRRRRPGSFEMLLSQVLPVITISRAIGRSVRMILNELMKLDDESNNEKQKHRLLTKERRHASHHYPYHAYDQKDDDGVDDTLTLTTHRRHQAAIVWTNTVAGTILATTVTSSVVPVPVLAASCAGTKLLLDCVSDEVVHNWFSMVRKIPPSKIWNTVHNEMYKRFEKQILYPAHEALNEIESFLFVVEDEELETAKKEELFANGNNSRRLVNRSTSSSSSSSNSNRSRSSVEDDLENPKLQRRVAQAVRRCMKLKIFWLMSTSGILVQTLLLHRQSIFHHMKQLSSSCRAQYFDGTSI